MAYYHCLLFDVDGTLLDFKAAENHALQDTLAHFGLPQTQQVLAAYHTINDSLWAALERGEIRQEKLVVRRFEQLLQQLDVQLDAAAVNDYYLSQLAGRSDTYPEVHETMNELAEVATLAVVSNGVERVQKKRLAQAGLDKYFDGFFVSERVGASKPSRRIFDTALRTLGVENREKVLMIGDSLKADIAGGAGAGLATCWCNFAGQPEPEREKPTHTICDLHELLEIVMEPEELENVGNPEKRHRF